MGVATLVGLAFLWSVSAIASDTSGTPHKRTLVQRSIARTGQSVRQGADWVRRRRSFVMDGVPYGLTGMPIIFYSFSTGFHYGGWIEIANYAVRPYKYRINAQWWLSTKGWRNHYIRLGAPSLFGAPIGVRLMLRDMKNISAEFFGIGNDVQVDEERLRTEPDYYRYHLEQQKTSLDVEFSPLRTLSFFAGVRFSRGVPMRADETKVTYYVFSDTTLFGRGAGWANFLAFGVIFDRRDDQELPTRGSISELSLQKAYRWLGTDYVYRRITLIHTQYHRLRPKYILVGRMVLENLQGDVPFYQLTEVGGSVRSFEMRDNVSLRGYRANRFADRQKLLLTVELRRILRDRTWREQYFQTQAVLFFDAGRVAPSLRQLTPRGLRFSGGAGVRLVWNSQLNFRADLALSPEGHRTLISFGNLF